LEIKIKSALISVSDKSGLEPLLKKLNELKVNIISTGGTSKFIEELNISVTDISDLTNFPEMMDGRVKTLHPNVHGGLLAIRDNEEHKKSQDKFGIADIDLLISNLYPFEKTINTNNDFEICIENIDIGGPAMLRSASKNHNYVCVISDISDYAELIRELGDKGSTSLEFRTNCAAKTFERTAHYDGMISHWFKSNSNIKNQKFIKPAAVSSELRYGENPHQSARIFQNSFNQSGIPSAHLVQGKDLSYNNINDADAALQLIKEFGPAEDAAVAIIKHANPCGVASGESLNDAYHKAFACDPNSAFGGIIAVNKKLDAETAKSITKIFTEVIIAPDVTDDAKSIIALKKNLRLLVCKNMFKQNDESNFKSIQGGILYQSNDNHQINKSDLKIVTEIKPNDQQIDDMLFAFKVCKHVKSNAIVYVKNKKTIGIGAGQMSRVDSAKIAVAKNLEMSNHTNEENSLSGCTVASDAFFPFPDGLMIAIESGATSVIQPGGSIKDTDIINAANNAGIAMALTGIRHFKH
jgi:phosphoribosylaminoimidazolecarboxamide formyltransferase/IMP cyclohydrolase